MPEKENKPKQVPEQCKTWLPISPAVYWVCIKRNKPKKLIINISNDRVFNKSVCFNHKKRNSKNNIQKINENITR